MKKNYSIIFWILGLVVFFFALKKIDDVNQAMVDSLVIKRQEEEFLRSRLSKNRENEIKNIISKAEDKRLDTFLKANIQKDIDKVSKGAASHVRDLAKTYPQVKGRIIINGTEIDFPVVQGTDNEFYLDHDFDNSYYINGGVFIDHVHKADFSDQNTVIYGHNVRIGYIFHDLDKFRDKDFAQNHSEIIIDTPKERKIFDVICAMDVKADADYRYSYYEDDEFDDYLKLIEENNILEGKRLPSKEDKLLTLSTCSDLSDRFAIVAVERKDKYVRPKNFNHTKSRLMHDKRYTTRTFIY